MRFVFQPAEEASGGAALCISEGILKKPNVDRCLGLHISADVPVGEINVAPGPFFASPTSLRITIAGRGGHAASPHQSVDSVLVAAHVITALQTVVSRSLPPLETAVLTIGKMEAGFRGNVIAESAELRGTIRTYSERVRARMLAKVEEVVSGVCAAFGATAEIKHKTSCPPLVNDEAVTAFVQAEGERYFGTEARVSRGDGGGGHAYFLEERPGCYFWLGARNESNGVAGRHHDRASSSTSAPSPWGWSSACACWRARWRSWRARDCRSGRLSASTRQEGPNPCAEVIPILGLTLPYDQNSPAQGCKFCWCS